MVGGRPSSNNAEGTMGLWKHQSIYKGKRPAHAQLPLLHQLLGYIGKRDFPTDGSFWKLPFGKRPEQDFVGETDDRISSTRGREKRDYDHLPLLHYTFGKRAYEPLLHQIAGKRSWNDFPLVLPKTKRYENEMPLLHQFGFGKRAYGPLLHSIPGKKDYNEDEIDRLKRQKEILEHTIDENEDYYLGKRSTSLGAPPPYDESIDDMKIRSNSDSQNDEARKWRSFTPRIERKRRSVSQVDQKKEEKKGWGSGKINLDELKSGSWFGKRDVKEGKDKKGSPILHQIGGITGKRTPSQLPESIHDRRKKATPILHQLGTWGKRFGDDIVWGKLYQAKKRSAPMLHEIGSLDKRFDDDIMWDTYMNGMKRNAALLHQAFGKRFDDDITWDTFIKEMKRNAPLLHQMFGKRFDDDIMWDTYMNGMKRNAPLLHQALGKKFDDDIMWDTYMNGQALGKRFDDDITWDTYMNGMKRNAPLLHQMFGKRFDDDITWDTFFSEMKKYQNFDKKFDDDIKWDTYFNGMKRNQDKKASPILHQLNSLGKKSTPILHQLGMTGKRSDDDLVTAGDDNKRVLPLMHQMGSVGKRSEANNGEDNGEN